MGSFSPVNSPLTVLQVCLHAQASLGFVRGIPPPLRETPRVRDKGARRRGAPLFGPRILGPRGSGFTLQMLEEKSTLRFALTLRHQWRYICSESRLKNESGQYRDSCQFSFPWSGSVFPRLEYYRDVLFEAFGLESDSYWALFITTHFHNLSAALSSVQRT